MSTTATLLAFPEGDAWKNAFSFDHAMAHRGLMSVMGPLDQWTLMPYWIDPTQYEARPATNWHQNHQQAHNDFTQNLPAYATATEAGIPSNQILVDTKFQDRGSRSWWTFANHQEHLIAANAIVTQWATVPTYWWALEPRRVATFW